MTIEGSGRVVVREMVVTVNEELVVKVGVGTEMVVEIVGG